MKLFFLENYFNTFKKKRKIPLKVQKEVKWITLFCQHWNAKTEFVFYEKKIFLQMTFFRVGEKYLRPTTIPSCWILEKDEIRKMVHYHYFSEKIIKNVRSHIKGKKDAWSFSQNTFRCLVVKMQPACCYLLLFFFL